MLKILKFILIFIAVALLAYGVGWCLMQLEFMIKVYTDLGKTLHYIGLIIISVIFGLYGASIFTSK